MNGIEFALSEDKSHVNVIFQPQSVPEQFDLKSLNALFEKSDYSSYLLLDNALPDALAAFKKAKKANSSSPVDTPIAEKKDAIVNFTFTDSDLTVYLNVEAPYGGSVPSVSSVVALAKDHGISRGLSPKRIASALERARNGKPGEIIEAVIARGLPAKNGKNSKLKPLVPNALERILRPQETGSNRVDMRNLGDVICVKTGTELLRRLPPTNGRNGYNVKGALLLAKPGDWKKLEVGEGTVVSDHDENLLIASITGMPKFKDQKMWVDDTFICNGVNVGTGNINYDGAVLVNGDVTEKMIIVASGDVTINGFVESATIQAGGDIIVTEGAMGKVNDASTEYSTKLVSQGSVHVQHGQGLDINCSGNVTVGRQLAYSRILCGGSVTVGPIDKPNGNLFACDIQCHGQVAAGTLGAVSGSNLSIDFSGGFNLLLERKDTLEELLKQLVDNYTRHELKMDRIRAKRIHQDLKRKYEEAESMFNSEKQLLQWLQIKAEKMRSAKDVYQQEIRLLANKRLYPGVVVKLNNRTWRADREYGKSCIYYEGHQWQYAPVI